MTPLLIYGDAPDSHSGLGRISRDLCTIACTMPEFHVASFGRGAIGSSRLPWQQYAFDSMDQWGEHKIRKVWQDFTGSTSNSGIILTVWDASRLLWFTGTSPLDNNGLDVFLGPNKTFERWGYFMIDGTGPDGRTLPCESSVVMKAYDRVVVASEWGAKVARASGVECEWIPHPVDGTRFHYHHSMSRDEDDRIIVGCCMTNQARKDWPTAFAIAGLLVKEHKSKFLFWAHTDSVGMEAGTYWNLRALAHDYGIPSECLRMTFTGSSTDSMMATMYASCDATILPSGGEGFGYPIAESLCCGCPCITQDYAAGAELTRPEWRIPVPAYKLETSHNILRAVHSPYAWAEVVHEAIGKGRVEGKEWRQEIAKGMEHLHIKNLKQVWRRWLGEGLQ